MTTTTEKRPSRRRRGNGEGSIFQRKSDGRWCATINVGYNELGKRRRQTVYGDTKKDVQDQLTRLQSRKLSGTLAESGKQTVGQYLDYWLEQVAKTETRPTTYWTYEQSIRKHIKPRIGGVALGKLTPIHVQQMCADMQAKSAERQAKRGGASVCQMAYAVVHRALKHALQMGLVARNVSDAVKRPRMPRSEVQALTADQAKALLTAARGDPLEALFVLALTSGMRLGELLGLQWEDVDLANGYLMVRYTLAQIKGEMSLSEPKTAKSRRRIELSGGAVAALEEHRRKTLTVGGHVFRAADGGPVNRDDLYRHGFRPLLEKAGIPRTKFHNLRHTAASLLLADEVHPKIVSELLGHSTVGMTLDTYSHCTPTMSRRAIDRLGAMLAEAAG